MEISRSTQLLAESEDGRFRRMVSESGHVRAWMLDTLVVLAVVAPNHHHKDTIYAETSGLA